MEFQHYSVMLAETISQLDIKPDGTYVDGTLGGGGHAFEVCKQLGTGHFYGIDQEKYTYGPYPGTSEHPVYHGGRRESAGI